MCLIRVASADTNGAYSLVEIVLEPGDGTPLHVHRNEDEYSICAGRDSACRGRRRGIRCGTWSNGHASQEHSACLGQPLGFTAADRGGFVTGAVLRSVLQKVTPKADPEGPTLINRHGVTEALDEMRHAVLITVIADVVRNYVELRALQSRLEALRNDVTAAQKMRDAVQTRYDQGLTNELEVAQAKRELATLESRLPELTARISAAENRMAVLLGTYSGAIVPELRRPGRIPHIPERLRSGRPLDLLRRRPDIRQAERELAAANARIGASIADLFPTVAVTAGFGAQGGPVLQNSTPPIHGPIWSIGPSGLLALPRFRTPRCTH